MKSPASLRRPPPPRCPTGPVTDFGGAHLIGGIACGFFDGRPFAATDAGGCYPPGMPVGHRVEVNS